MTLDIYTPSVVYDQLLPVVVYVDGDDLSEEDDETIRPSAGWFIWPINVTASALFPSYRISLTLELYERLTKSSISMLIGLHSMFTFCSEVRPGGL